MQPGVPRNEKGLTMTRILVLLAAATLLGGCHTMRFEVGEGTSSNVVYHRKSFYVGGLFPTRTVDVSQFCPSGAVAVREETTFVDGLFNLVTLGIWTPRSSWYYCAAEEA